MQIPILNGIYADGGAPDFRTSYPRNLIPVPKVQGLSNGYLRPADGIEQIGTGPGVARGGIAWGGFEYRVMGTSLVRIEPDGGCTVLADVGPGGTVTLDYGFDRLAIASGGVLWYWNGGELTRASDPDLGPVVDVRWIGGYFLATDGTSLISSDLNDPTSFNILNYGSAESDPDPLLAVDELRNEAYAFGRYTVEVFQNVGGSGFPFRRIDGAQITKGVIGTHAYTSIGDTFVFIGSGRGEAPAVHQMVPGNTQKISTREIDAVLASYTEAELATAVVEKRVHMNHSHVLFHLPRECWVYDIAASQAMEEPVWFSLSSSIVGQGVYRARHLVWCYGRWGVADPTSGAYGKLIDTVSTHYGQPTGWDFGTMVLYNPAGGGIVHELELVCLTGSVAQGSSPVIWTQYSTDGQTWSNERSVLAGRQGQRSKRICWRDQGRIENWRVQRFRGTSDAHLSVVRLEARIEALNG